MAAMKEAAELKKIADELISIAERLEGTDAKEEPEKEISFTDIRAILATKVREGKQEKIREILKSHGAEKLSDIDPKDYPALAKEAEVL